MDVASTKKTLSEIDPEIACIVRAEADRQNRHLELIASENYCSAAVRAAMGSVLTDKYAEGYPGKRWYEGCAVADDVERLAIKRAKALFGADHANVQPHAGSQANMAVYLACMENGATILGMDLAHGGHLTHGHPMNFSGRLFKVFSYGVDRETERIDYKQVAELAERERPAIIVAGASSYSRKIDFKRFRAIADSVGALLMADAAHIAGLVATKLHPDPVPLADFVTATTHKTLRGPRSGFVLCKQEYADAIDKAVFPGMQGGPLMHMIAAKAVAFHEALMPDFRLYQERVLENAATMAGVFAARGYRVVSGGTDNHLFLVDVTSKGLTGHTAARRLSKANITLNKNVIPFDPKPPLETSGIRIGSPAMTTRGMGVVEAENIASWICDILDHRDDDAVLRGMKEKVDALCGEFPVYAECPG